MSDATDSLRQLSEEALRSMHTHDSATSGTEAVVWALHELTDTLRELFGPKVELAEDLAMRGNVVISPIDVPCPTCHVDGGASCVSAQGPVRIGAHGAVYHSGRWERAFPGGVLPVG